MFERLMPHVRLSNGVARTTFRNRFRNLDPLVNDVLSRNFSSREELVVEDWAASTCLTSYEWAESLFALFPRLRFTASDGMLYLIEVEDAVSGEVFVTEQDGRPLQYIRPPFAICMAPPESWTAPLNRVGYQWAKRRWRKVGEIGRAPDAWFDWRCEEMLERNGRLLRKLPLIHPRALELARRDERFSIRRHSVFERAPAPCHVIRSMNILNRSYFSEHQLFDAARSVAESLHAGGIWIVGRTTCEDPPVHDVSVLRKLDSGLLQVVERTGAGSEIESIALDVAAVLA
ncbi:MAG: hypothetical protein JOY54_13000 [Acidobacteriaceae bacterium]|nr:hypothetical protein [Acidobacteriaceae bacterium]